MAIDAQRPNLNFAAKGDVSPFQNFQMTVPRGQYEKLFDRIEEFAEANGFQSRIAHFDAKPELYSIDIWRKNALISGDRWSDDPTFTFSFYIAPEAGGTPAMASELAEKFVAMVREIEGVSIDAAN